MTEQKKENIDLYSTFGGQGAWVNYIHDLQNRICAVLEKADGKEKFREDKWERVEGGGGITKVIANGNVFEKGGVNTSVVWGDVSNAMRTQLKYIPAGNDSLMWWACGLSLVLHPVNPFVPTVHCNYRMFELYKKTDFTSKPPQGRGALVRWFGGGTDLTPYYLFDEDAKHFHGVYKKKCDGFDLSLYPEFKKWCDDYFVNTHRNNERRGIGGIFYDYKGRLDQQNDSSKSGASGQSAYSTAEDRDGAFWMNFGKACGDAFIESYIPIVEKRKNNVYSEHNKHWQEIRRGRYVEFNLIHDRGTLFGLKTGGRTESILMSLPPTVRFEYDYHPIPGSEEDKLLQVCLQPKEWV